MNEDKQELQKYFLALAQAIELRKTRARVQVKDGRALHEIIKHATKKSFILQNFSAVCIVDFDCVISLQEVANGS